MGPVRPLFHFGAISPRGKDARYPPVSTSIAAPTMPPNAPSPNSKDLEAPRRSKRARKPPNRPEAMLLDSKNQKRALSTLVPKTASRAPSKPHPPRKVSLESQGDCPAMSVEPTVKKQRTVSPLTPSSSASRNSTRRTRTPAKVDTPKISNKKRSAVPFVSKRFRTKPPPQKGALQNLTQAMMRYIQDAPNQVLRVPVASEDLGVPKRRIYDVLHVMEGAGLVEPFNNGHGKNQNDYRWIHNMNKRHRMEPPSPEFALVQKLEAEEKELDHWIAMLKIDDVYHAHTQAAHDYFYSSVQKCSNAETVLRQWSCRGRVLLLVYPPPGRMAIETIRAYTAMCPENDTVLLVSEGRGGANGNDDLFAYLENGEWDLLGAMHVKAPPGGKGYEELFILKRRLEVDL